MSLSPSDERLIKKQGLPDAQDCYIQCVEDYHKTAKGLGFAEKGVIFVPELYEGGQSALLAYFGDERIKQLHPNPQDFYYHGVTTMIRYGIACGALWHKGFGNRAAETLSETLLTDYAGNEIRQKLKLDAEGFARLSKQIFARWEELQQPYWQLQRPQSYLLSATYAACQLGVSMILCKYGYKGKIV